MNSIRLSNSPGRDLRPSAVITRPMRIFIGSSNEALWYAQEIQDLLYEEARNSHQRILVRGWWSRGVFPVGGSFIDSLKRVLKETDTAILLATEDDHTVTRGQKVMEPRDNITFESGLAISYLGQERTAIAVIGQPKLPSDLQGVTYLDLSPEPRDDFRERNRGKIRSLLNQWRVSSGEQPDNCKTNAQGVERVSHEEVDPRSFKLSDSDRELAKTLVEQIKIHDSCILARTNLILRYPINWFAVSELRREMRSGLKPRKLYPKASKLVTAAEYKDFEDQNNWRLLGYNRPKVLNADDGTRALSGMSEKELTDLLKYSGTSPDETFRGGNSKLHEAVRSVSWYDAAAYCLAVGGRLPTATELDALNLDERVKDIWEWSDSWFDEGAAHICVSLNPQQSIGVNPDLRLPNVGFRVVFVR